MLNRIVLSLKSWLVERRNVRALCRLDCRCLEDIGLDPGEVTGGVGRLCHRIRHHPSWDDDAGHLTHAQSRGGG
ncbi:DUF1127 domain-containing protein [Methylobacterium sp. J-070]|uniref:DUF1127 domain-containing protein n=1 Tax=Methylobacterium sp. J-070 TaxID=2836650 RepID=UPI00391B3193